MNDHQYTNLRTHIEGVESKLSQLIEAQKRTNALLEGLSKPSATNVLNGVEAEPPVTVETVNEDELKTVETVEIVPAPAAAKSKPKGRPAKPSKPGKPDVSTNVNRNS